MIIIHACTMVTVHVSCPIWLSPFARRSGGPGGEAPRLSRGVWGAARPPKGGSPSTGGGIVEREMLQDWTQEYGGGVWRENSCKFGARNTGGITNGRITLLNQNYFRII